MKIYWTLKQIPELAELPRKERGTRWRRAYYRTFKHWEMWAGIVAGMVIVVGVVILGQVLVGGPSFIWAAIGGGLCGFVISQVGIGVVLRHYRGILRGEVADDVQ